jgi:hypothetical protein
LLGESPPNDGENWRRMCSFNVELLNYNLLSRHGFEFKMNSVQISLRSYRVLLKRKKKKDIIVLVLPSFFCCC